MKSFPKLLHRFFLILFFSLFLLLFFNMFLLFLFIAKYTPNSSPWLTAESVAQNLTLSEDGYRLSAESLEELKEANAWAMLIDEQTKTVIWQTDNLPAEIPKNYTLSDIASLTRGYIEDFPTFTGERDDGLLVVGYPPQSFWKHLWPSWDLHLISQIPQFFLVLIACNLLLIFLIYLLTNVTLFRSVRPIVQGIQSLALDQEIYVSEKGILSEIASNINHASEILRTKNRLLKKKETARANWIAGVSHDIRTPLSMVMGYSGQLENDPHLTDVQRQKISVIRRQGERIKNLVNDLNLSSKLEYHMQPLHCRTENMISLVRQVVVDFINLDIENLYPIEWLTKDSFNCCMADVDKDLIQRAISNLIQNSMTHNETGCHIYVCVKQQNHTCQIQIEDDGIGITQSEVERLNHTPHYMLCDENTDHQRHGLGLLLVRQIALVHKGSFVIGCGSFGGFLAVLTLPCSSKSASDSFPA